MFLLKSLILLPRFTKQILMVLCDFLILPLAMWSALALRYSSLYPDVYVPAIEWLLLAVPLLAVPIFLSAGLYRAVIRYANGGLIETVIYSVSVLTLLLAAGIFMTGAVGIPRSSLVIFWLIAILLIGLSRYGAQRVIYYSVRGSKIDQRARIAIYGAGRAGVQLAMALSSSPEYRVLAFFDDNRQLQGRTILGIRVYSPNYAGMLVNKMKLGGLILALPSAARGRRKEIIQSFEKYGLTLKILPGMAELIGGKVRIEDLREVGVEDLLGRDPVPPDEVLLEACITHKSVMVTGAGGSIGSELCRQIVRKNPSQIVLFESSEFALYRMEQDLKGYGLKIPIVACLGDVRDFGHIKEIMTTYRVQTVYHAAAYKHVPLVEWNVASGVSNNVLGTLSSAKAAKDAQVETFVLVSTDKAVRPTNVMGASKRLAELILQAFSKDKTHQTRFCMVRFGNVLGSSGSVVPLFKEQIRKGGPVTVTHKEVTRYFMTIPEAAQLVLQAGSMGSGGDVFVLDMGESVKIVDLACKMIRLSGLSVKGPENPEGDIAIEFTGLRPGEKLFEELLIGNNVSQTHHPRILRAEESFIPWGLLEGELAKLSHSCEQQDEAFVRSLLRSLVIEYSPMEQDEDEKTLASSEKHRSH